MYICKQGIEDAEHFLQDCELYNGARSKVRKLYKIDLRQYQTEELLEGDLERSDIENQHMFEVVQWYIGESGMF